ncbi:MAG: glycosyltransferase family 2 protein [Prevotella sp.]|nr:glycosyltransferase family 2 protein [Prevotella sp.]
MIAVSVVVPIYRAEATLLRCLDSLRGQTLRDFEVLMIDDGSPDNCGAMIDEYARQDNRFKAIHQVNSGVSAARQCGIDHAQGEYTIHADPDDWVEPAMLEALYAKAKADDADMVICDFYENSYQGQSYVRQQPSGLESGVILQELFLNLHGSCWNKLIRRSCYEQFGVSFPAGVSFCEDQYVIAALLKNNIKVAYLPKAFYHYVRDNVASLSRVYTERSHQEDLLVMKLFMDLLGNTPVAHLAERNKQMLMVVKAFYGGRRLYSSSEFKRLFGSYSTVFQEHGGGWLQRTMIRMACRGWYQPVIALWQVLQWSKHQLLTLR